MSPDATHRMNRPLPEGTIDVTTSVGQQSHAAVSIVVVGAGGHGRELADIVRQTYVETPFAELLGIVDDGKPDRLALARGHFRFLGTTEALLERVELDRTIEVYIGIGLPHIRKAVDQRLQCAVRPLIHPTAIVGSASTLGAGVVLAQGSILTTNVALGRHTHVNVGATISHDCVVGDYVTVCPGATITGNVTIGDGAFIGAGATILPGVTIARGARVGAGATVTRDVRVGDTVVGSPARSMT